MTRLWWFEREVSTRQNDTSACGAGCPHANKLPQHAEMALRTQRACVRMRSWLSTRGRVSTYGAGSLHMWKMPLYAEIKLASRLHFIALCSCTQPTTSIMYYETLYHIPRTCMVIMVINIVCTFNAPIIEMHDIWDQLSTLKMTNLMQCFNHRDEFDSAVATAFKVQIGRVVYGWRAICSTG